MLTPEIFRRRGNATPPIAWPASKGLGLAMLHPLQVLRQQAGPAAKAPPRLLRCPVRLIQVSAAHERMLEQSGEINEVQLPLAASGCQSLLTLSFLMPKPKYPACSPISRAVLRPLASASSAGRSGGRPCCSLAAGLADQLSKIRRVTPPGSGC